MKESRRTRLEKWLGTPAADSPEGQRAQLLTYLILGSSAAALLLLAVNVLQWLSAPSSARVVYVAADVVGLLLLAALWYLNRAGRTAWAGLALLLVLSALAPLMLPFSALDRVLIVWAIPVMVASRVLWPNASFLFATVAVGIYTVLYLRAGSPMPYNLISMALLFPLALLAWFITDRQRRHLAERAKADRSQLALLRISQAAGAASDLPGFLATVHRELAALLAPDSFYVALYDASNESYSFPYAADEHGAGAAFTPQQLRRSLTDYVRRTAAPLFADVAVHERLMQQGEVDLVGHPSPTWMGAPLKTAHGVIGVVVVQDYQHPLRYSGRDLELLALVADHIAALIDRKRSDEALRVSEERYRSVARLISDFAYSCIRQDTGAYQLEWITDAFFSMTAYSQAELDQKKCWMFVSYPEDAEFAAEPLRRLRVGERDSREFRILTKHGRALWVRNEMECVADSHTPGQTRLFGAVRDITAARQAQQERLDMERRLLHAQKLESLGVLAGGIAHDFNNLLMALLGNLELAQENLSPVSPARPRVEQAVLAAKRAADLTRQMLAYSGKGRFDVTHVDLSELVQENAHMLRAAVSRNVTFNLRLSKDLPPILADAGQIQQVVMNLISNASEAIGEGPGIVALATGAQACDDDCLGRSLLEDKPAPGEFVWLEVTDTGCGMDEDTLQRIFEPFFTTKLTGRGLGMSAVHGIVRGHQGAILIDSQVGKGTAIRVLFPAAEQPAAQSRLENGEAAQSASRLENGEAAQSASRRPSGEAAHSASRRRDGGTASLVGTVLVVDDEPMVRELCAATLTDLGLQVLTAADGMEAVVRFREHADEIVCVLLDLTMPHMDGVATLELLCQIRPDVRVILSSGYDEQEATRRFAGRGLEGFLQKPYQVRALRAALRRVLTAGA